MWSVWRTVLEENEKLSKARLAAIEVYIQQIADDAKILRIQKLQATKKVGNPTFLSDSEFSSIDFLYCGIVPV